MEDSLFTKIIKGEIPCHKIYEDERVIAFLDVHPKQPGHTLVVPKIQVDLIWNLEDSDYSNLWLTAKKIASHIGPLVDKRVGILVEGVGVPHTHVHLVPFSTTEEFLHQPDMSIEPDHQALAEIAQKLAFS